MQWKPSELVNSRSYKELWQYCWMLMTISVADGGGHPKQPECKCSTWAYEHKEKVNQSSTCLLSVILPELHLIYFKWNYLWLDRKWFIMFFRVVVCSLKRNKISKLGMKGVNKWLWRTSKSLPIKFIKGEKILSVSPEGINRFTGLFVFPINFRHFKRE